jgi:hypothetical protein
MGKSNNREPRRLWKSTQNNRVRVACASCGANARPLGANLPFCNACLDWARQSNLADWDELGAGD